MERGMMILRGQALSFEADWHPVQAGDAIWAAPYCPQWFVALGKTPASFHLLPRRESGPDLARHDIDMRI